MENIHCDRIICPSKNLGLVGDNAVRFDEVEYCKALERAGFWGVWVPAAKVRHFVVARRMTLEYVWKHFEGEGRGTTRINGTSPGRPLFGAPRWLYRQYAAAKLDYWWKRARRHPEWLRSFAWAAQIRGTIVEHRAKSAEQIIAGHGASTLSFHVGPRRVRRA